MKSKIGTTDYKNKNLLIRFYRFATCPICNLHLRNLVRRFDDLRTESLSVPAVSILPNGEWKKTCRMICPLKFFQIPERKFFQLRRGIIIGRYVFMECNA